MSIKNIINIKNIVNSSTDMYSNDYSDTERNLIGGDNNDEKNNEIQDETQDEKNDETQDEKNDETNNNVKVAESSDIDLSSIDDTEKDSELDAEKLIDDLEGVEPNKMAAEPITSYIKTVSIPKGTILYHSSYTRDTFDPVKINLNKGKKYLSAFFSTNRKTASARIKGCTKYPQKDGYIHTFEVKNDIDNIYLLSQYDLSDWRLKDIDDKYCNSLNDDGDKYNGIGFYILKGQNDNKIASSEFALCNPKRYLTYINTIKCKSYGEYSSEYRFDEKNKI